VIATKRKTGREISRRVTRVAFALEIRRADGGTDQFGEQPDTRYSVLGRASAFPTITVSTNECNAVSQPLSPSLIYFDPRRVQCSSRAYGSANQVSERIVEKRVIKVLYRSTGCSKKKIR